MSLPIVHQTQPLPDACACTCLAMLSGQPAATIIDSYHAGYRDGSMSVFEIMDKLGICAEYAEGHTLHPGNLYLLYVASLNLRGVLHQVIADMREGSLVIFDPNKGRAGKSYYYVGHEQLPPDPLAVQLTDWGVDARIVVAPALQFSVR